MFAKEGLICKDTMREDRDKNVRRLIKDTALD